MDSGQIKERRRYRRYIARGEAQFVTQGFSGSAELVNFGFGGMLLRVSDAPPAGTELRVRVLASCYPTPFEVVAQIVGGRDGLTALKFLEKSRGARELLCWLEQENCPWTGTTGSIASVGAMQPAVPAAHNLRRASQASPSAQAPEDVLEHVYQSA